MLVGGSQIKMQWQSEKKFGWKSWKEKNILFGAVNWSTGPFSLIYCIQIVGENYIVFKTGN